MNESTLSEIEPLGKPALAFLIFLVWGMFVLARRRKNYHLRIDRIHWITYCVTATVLLALVILGVDFARFLD